MEVIFCKFYVNLFEIIRKLAIFVALSPLRKPEGGREGTTHIWQRRLLRFVLDTWKLRNFQILSRTWQQWMPYGMCYVRVLSVGVHLCADELTLHSYQAWASVLLVRQYRAMRRPPSVGRVTARTPTLFCICTWASTFYFPVFGCLQDCYKQKGYGNFTESYV